MALTYRQTLQYLLEHLPMFQRVGAAAYRTDLHNIIQLCNILGNPHAGLKCIHVAGTNGKGSVTHFIASILQEQGYRVGVFVSPHYKDYRERIKINGQYISKNFVREFVNRNIDKFRQVDASFFEITTAMAFDYFKRKKVDFAVIETGMGGRLDSTNIVTPLLSVITNISLDHQQFLGNTLSKIAAEKAGIIKPGVPVVIGETQKETLPVFLSKAKACDSKIYFAESKNKPAEPAPGIHGSYQKKNIATTLAAVSVLKEIGIKVSGKAVHKGMKNVTTNTSFIGRWMIKTKRPLVVFDSAHNEGGWREIKKEIEQISYHKLHIVFGTVGDKDIHNILSILPRKAVYYFCQADIPRAMDSQQLTLQAREAGLTGENYTSVKQAYTSACLNASKSDMILVAGSVFVVAELL